ncbi:MAG: hypothetical protein IBX50_08495 [Marinospirillum sp.]|uniref:hypothetical protein n=1 Tax=Marinospirillum sp. TaxID=2183934 RepID=UPI0019E37F40|nr:hypothetical protein [Marinospirillum sp.]MBE0506745.1 hypothetical protein [Marinospirillum sp.]
MMIPDAAWQLLPASLPLLAGKHGVFRVIVFGGCAVHIYTQSRGSGDIDAEIASHGMARKSEILGITGHPGWQNYCVS